MLGRRERGGRDSESMIDVRIAQSYTPISQTSQQYLVTPLRFAREHFGTDEAMY